MRAVVQRVRRCRVLVESKTIGEIGAGLLVLLGVGKTDTETSAQDGGGEVLVVSQFTLCGDVRRGKRPSFDAAARPEDARRLYEYFVAKIRSAGLRCETGQFQAMMEVELTNSGPVTILLDSEKMF